MATRRYELKSAASTTPAPRVNYALNPEQLGVVFAPLEPVLVIAGAGSGKTRTLMYRLARMLELGFSPESILLLTFTNKAAQEMKRRATDLLSIDGRRITGGTFHHVGLRILREHAAFLGLSDGFSILDREDQIDLMASCTAELNLAVGQHRFPRADVLVEITSAAINTQKGIAEVLLARKPQFAPITEEILRVAQRYVERKLELHVLDFDDLLLYWKVLLSDHPAVRAALGKRYACVLVDEYQDTNRLQGDIIDLMASGHRNLTVVGDDAQSIYSFRGADFRNILEFPVRYPGCHIHNLTVNYRSSPEILRLANLSIARNVHQYKKRSTRGT